ncbi:MAG: hypothetical protein ACI4C7_08395, partial [Clostridia bacterium]
MKKLISMLISISMIFTMLPTLTFAEEETADVYTSTEKYSENTNGTWDNGVWSTEVYSASNGTYTTLTNKNGDDYCDAYTGHWDGFLANGKKLQTTAANSSDSVVRAFTAPKDGIVTISQCREFQESGGNPLAIRITLTKSGETTTIWPEAGIDMAVNKDNGYRDVGGWNFVTQRTVNDIEVSKGDIIRFEMKKQNSTDGSGGLNWENTVTYKHYTKAPITYSSLDNYSNAESNATWNNGMWKAQTLSGTTYTNMAGKNGDEYCFGWTGNWDGFLAGGKKLQTAAGNSSDSAVRTFTAPRTGIVNIEKTKFQESNNGKAGVRIIIQRTGEETAETLWPDEKIDPNITDGHISFGNWNWVTQREINGISVKKGDIIRFEMKKLNGSDERSVINWENKITYTAYAEALPVPQISINYADEKLTGFAVNEKYTIGDNEITSADGSLDIDSAWFNTTLSIVMKGDSITNEDSETQSLEIPERPAAPTETDITVTHPAVINGTGSVSGVSGTEYKAAESEEWTACEGNEITGLAAGTYNIRKKATDTSFKSDIYSFTINAFEPSKEATPEIAVDYANEKLTDFGEGSYTVNGGAVTPENGSLAIASYMDTTVKIIKKGNGTITTDSEEQSLIIPARPTAPTVTAIDESSVGANNGKITDVTDAMEYKLSSAQEWTPVGNGVTEITNLAPGSYNVRYKATASSFASLSNTVAINAKGVQEPTVTVPTLGDVIYTDGMKLLDISLAGIQIPSGDTPGAFTWKIPNMLVNAGDNQSFDAVFTPADTTNFKIKELQIPVNIKPATITGITVTGYEGNADGQTHGVTVMGARAGDTVTYKVDDGEFASDAPSYTEVCEHTVTVKVVRANYTDFIAEPVTVKIKAKPKEPTPKIVIDYTKEKLTGFGEGSYTVNGGAVTPENGSLAIASYMDTTVKIIKKGNGTITTDSEEQSLIIPARPTAPTVTAIDESSVGANNGKITDVTDAMEYKLSSAQEWTPVGNGVTEITNLAPGSYNVRYKATASSFASLSNTVAINAKGVQEPTVTVPTLGDVIYTDGMKLLDISLAGIQIPSGDTPGAFTWKIPNMLVNAGDNQSFDAVFTPADTTNFKIKELQIPVNIKPATITGITVTGYEGNADGQTHGVTVMGARAGDTVTYKVDDGEFASDAPSYTEVCEHTVTVKVVRANYTDFIAEPVTVKITAEPKPSPGPTFNPQTPKIYISTAKFNTDKGDGTWQRGIWAAQRCEKDVYENLTVVKNNGYSSDKTNGIVSADKFITSNEATEERLVRVFTAPMDGTVTINKTDITGGEFLTSARILKADKNNNVTTLMPKDLNAWPGTGFSYIYEWTPVTQEEIKDIAIEKGERLLFEIVKSDDNGSSEIKWTNTVTYTSYDETTLDPEPTPTPTPKPTLAPPLEQGTYKSSHNFIPEDGNGIWESVWSAEIYNSTDRTYTDAKTKYKDGYAKNNTDEKQPVVYGNKMRVSGADIPDMHPVRKFTVPKDGSLRILQSEITHKTWEEVQYNIKLNDTVIWTKAYSDSGAKLIQPEQRLKDVKAGDVIRFEMILKEGTSYGYEQLWENTILEWDGTEPTPTPPIIPTPTPTVKPTPEPTLNPDLGKTSYRASDSWSMEKNGDDVWRWQSYKTETKVYEDLPQKMESNMNMGDDWDDGPVWIAGDDWRWAAIGKYTMRASVDPGDPTAEETRGDFKAHRDYPVRTFTSPKNGTVSIHASSDKIFAKDNMYGTHIRIMCQRADGSKPIQIFPNAEEMAWLNIKGEYNFEPIEFELNAGDKLMFENAFIWKEGGYSPWNTYVRWDPIVEYKTINPKLMSITPENGAENVPINAEHVLSYDGALNSILKEKVSVYEVNSEGESIESDAVCSSIAVEGSAIKFVVDGLKPYTKYEVKVDGICYSGFDNKNEKS